MALADGRFGHEGPLVDGKGYDTLDTYLIYAPERSIRGEVLAVNPPTFPLDGAAHPVVRTFIVYLSPNLERERAKVVLGTVAHEIAHAWLRHGVWVWHRRHRHLTEVQQRDGSTIHTPEPNAWSQVVQWGFSAEAEAAKAATSQEETLEAIG